MTSLYGYRELLTFVCMVERRFIKEYIMRQVDIYKNKCFYRKRKLPLKWHNTSKGQRSIWSGAKVNLCHTAVGHTPVTSPERDWQKPNTSERSYGSGLVKLGPTQVMRYSLKHLSSLSVPRALTLHGWDITASGCVQAPQVFIFLLFCCRHIEPINEGLSGSHARSQVLI